MLEIDWMIVGVAMWRGEERSDEDVEYKRSELGWLMPKA